MIRKIRFQPLAAAEVVEAQLLYENRVPGLGDRLMGAVQGTTEGAVRWPNAGTPTRNDAMGKVLERKVATPGFPYVVSIGLPISTSRCSPCTTSAGARCTGLLEPTNRFCEIMHRW